MQVKNIAVAALAGFASAQDISSFIAQIPSCALTCLLQGATTVGCQAIDYTCQCTHAADIQAAVQPCLGQSTCTPADLAKVQEVSVEICKSLGAGSGPTSVPGGASETSVYPTTAAPTGNYTMTSGPTSTSTTTSSTSGPTAGAAEIRAGLSWVGAALIGALAL